MGFKIKKTVNGVTVWNPIKVKKYTTSKTTEYTGTLPITINANGNALLDYRIYGNTVQDSTPTPENPVDVVGCGERTENLFDVSAYSVGTTNFITKRITLEPNTTYTMSSNCPLYNLGALIAIGNISESFTTAKNGVYPNHPISRTTDANGELVIGLRSNGGDYMPTDYDTMLNAGSTALPYEPYGYKLPMMVSDENTVQTVPIYLGESQTTRRIKKLVLTGTSTDGNSNVTAQGIIFITPKTALKSVGAGYCTHFKYVNQKQGSDIPNNSFTTNGGAGTSLWFKTDYTTVNDFKSYLAAQYAAGTPVTVWYVLAEPETGIVNEPLMKIGDYADTLSMEQADVSIPTFGGTTVIDCDGTPKPEKMYIKYNSWSGWEPCTVKRYHNDAWIDAEEYVRHNGAWDEQ